MIKERVAQIADYKGINKEIFFSRIGVTSANFRGKAKKTPLSSATIENILSEFPDINIEWLITGKGDITNTPTKKERISSGNSLKLYDINKADSLNSLFQTDKNIIGEISIPNIPACDGAIYITGESMYPLLKSGDIIAFKKLTPPYNIIYGEMYLIEININGEQYVTVCYIKKSEQEGYCKLVCYNPSYDIKEILIASIETLAIIKISIRQNTMF